MTYAALARATKVQQVSQECADMLMQGILYQLWAKNFDLGII